jgi:hypothetical protein
VIFIVILLARDGESVFQHDIGGYLLAFLYGDNMGGWMDG